MNNSFPPPLSKSQSKYQNTALLMDQALLTLLAQKPYDSITIKELCETAGVNRSTFYQHYDGMGDLLTESLRALLGRMAARYQNEILPDQRTLHRLPLEELYLVTPRWIIPYLEFCRDHKALLLAAADRPASFPMQEIFRRMYSEMFEPILDRFRMPEWEKPYRMAFYLNGMHSVVVMWLRGDCAEAPGQIAELLMRSVHLSVEELKNFR